MKNLAPALLLLASSALCQSPRQTDPVQALLVEVHQLRLDIEAMTLASQRVQIALAALQRQDAVVARATNRADSARDRCTNLQSARDMTAGNMHRIESELSSGTLPDSRAADYRSLLPRMKSDLDAKSMELQNCQASEADAAAQLRADQAKLGELEERLDRLDKALESVSPASK